MEIFKQLGIEFDPKRRSLYGQRYSSLADALCEKGRFGRKTGNFIIIRCKCHMFTSVTQRIYSPDNFIANIFPRLFKGCYSAANFEAAVHQSATSLVIIFH